MIKLDKKRGVPRTPSKITKYYKDDSKAAFKNYLENVKTYLWVKYDVKFCFKMLTAREGYKNQYFHVNKGRTCIMSGRVYQRVDEIMFEIRDDFIDDYSDTDFKRVVGCGGFEHEVKYLLKKLKKKMH